MKNTFELTMGFMKAIDCQLVVKQYELTGGICLDIIGRVCGDDDTGLVPLLTATICVEGVRTEPPHFVYIKNYSENEGLLQELQRVGIVKEVCGPILTNPVNRFIRIPCCELDMSVVERYTFKMEEK